MCYFFVKNRKNVFCFHLIFSDINPIIIIKNRLLSLDERWIDVRRTASEKHSFSRTCPTGYLSLFGSTGDVNPHRSADRVGTYHGIGEVALPAFRRVLFPNFRFPPPHARAQRRDDRRDLLSHQCLLVYFLFRQDACHRLHFLHDIGGYVSRIGR